MNPSVSSVHQNPEISSISTLDSLRAFAVILVLWQHIPKAFLGTSEATLRTGLYPGALGVDLFFVLSGILITRILLANKMAGASPNNFYLRRACRIFPAYYLTLFVCLMIWWEIPPLLLAASYTLNIPIAIQVTVVAGIGSFMLMHYFASMNQEMGYKESFWAAYGFTGSRAYSILAGALFAFYENFIKRIKLVYLVPPLLVVTATVFAWVNYPFPTGGGLRSSYHLTMTFPLSIAIFLTFLLAEHHKKTRSLIANPSLVFIGKISFGGYLFHLPISYLYGVTNWPAEFSIRPKVLWALVITFGAAICSYYYVERPILRWSEKFQTEKIRINY